ncbi:hypothetical protein CAEBREN_13108 [Caenorhabditis brenneri]|uniref:Uncharacterized protein n=1 Tax=Caenorhabditis brenneri TaxID=135651 RepID=G0P1K6_CAEBE|nr:hypothetical protein CAEBREN_13108 [Caenorhabditis brenneri]
MRRMLQGQVNLMEKMMMSEQVSFGNLLGFPAPNLHEVGVQGSTRQSSNWTSALPSPLLGRQGLLVPSEVITTNVVKQHTTAATNTESDEELQRERMMLDAVRGQLATVIQLNGELIQENHCLQDDSRDLR